MIVIRWSLLSLFILMAAFLSIFLAPIACAFANRESGKLPAWAWWMETPTAILPGSKGYQRDNLEKWGWYLTSVMWLSRNKVYALSDKFRVDPNWETAKFWSKGDKSCNNDPYKPGYFLGTITWGNKKAFELCFVFPMPFNKCFMFRAGWKLSGWFDGRRFTDPGATGMFQTPSIRPLLSRK